MTKKEKIETHKHYFALDTKMNDIFIKYLEDNFISKQKLLENLVVKYLQEKKIIKSND
ncbi:hypothetical protein M0Q50_01075 [bacterium]|jgi:hypothetical protein|nr:hypothetical protein [bacterium]